jgi:hypothetical protein
MVGGLLEEEERCRVRRSSDSRACCRCATVGNIVASLTDGSKKTISALERPEIELALSEEPILSAARLES